MDRFDMDPQWAETGDRYFLKLFRDYVFHQVDEENRPIVDLGHVIQCLNKVCSPFQEIHFTLLTLYSITVGCRLE